MPAIPVRLYKGQPGTSAAVLYTVPPATKVIVKQIVACNVTAIDALFALSFLNVAESVGNANRIAKDLKVPTATPVLTLDVSQVLEAGEKINGQQTTSGAITLTISGVEIT